MTTRPGSSILHALHTHPRRSLAGVLFFIVLAGVFGGPVAGALESEGDFAPADSDSVVAVERIEAATGRGPSPGVVVLVERSPGEQGAQGRAAEVSDELAEIPGVAAVAPGGSAIDGSSSLLLATLDGDTEDTQVAEDVVDAFAEDSDVAVGGSAVANLQLGDQISEDLSRAELFAFPVLLLLSLLFFGGRAAVMPLVVGITTVLGTFLAMAGINQLYGLNVFVLNLVIGLGLGLAIDYTLFLLSRYREELERQGPTAGAIRTTMTTAGRTVVFSATTVSVALITLTVFPLDFLKSMGIAGAVVAAVAAGAALVISPIIFGLWGDKLARRRRATASEGRWYRLSHGVMKRPGAIAALTAVVMIVLAAPALRATWAPIDDTTIPEGLSARTVSDTLAADYEGGTTPVTVAIESADSASVQEYADRAGSVPGVVAASDAVDLGSDTWQLDLTVEGDPVGDTARSVVADVRELAAETDTDALVSGPAAGFIDQQDAIGDGLPLAAALLVLLTLLVLWLMTGSVVLPIKAVVMNALTVGVSLGAITFIYQDGRLTELLGYTPNGGVEPTDFLVSAAVVFALSTDYGVFLLGRIKEARDAGLSERESVATGLGHTGSVVTKAAILLAVAIGAFSTSEIAFIQQIGVATAVGVLVDAFVVRSLLVPSLMALLGKWNWWSPMPLRRLHDRIGLSEGDGAAGDEAEGDAAEAAAGPSLTPTP